MEKKNMCTPVKGFLEKATGRRTQNSDSPFCVMPNVSTPPSRFMKIKNPFEPFLTEKLHSHLVSPSIILTKICSPKIESKFKWNIDDISTIKPADIDETSIDQHEQVEDPVLESFAQANIDKFFSMKEIVPSPFNQSVKVQPLLQEKQSASSTTKTTRDNSSQTILTLPPILPKEVEDILRPFFTFTEDQQQLDIRNNSLYRKLFEFHDDHIDETATSICSSPARSLSPPRVVLLDQHKVEQRCDFGSPKLFENDCCLSPISTGPMRKSPAKKDRSANLTCQMNTSDISMNVVPSIDHMSTNSSMCFDENYEVMRIEENLSFSKANWDMEYKNVTLASSKDSSDEMDVSNSNTPRSTRLSGSRKKLSDSFLSEDDDVGSKISNTKFQDGLKDKATSSRLLIPNDTLDPGYHTAGYTMSEDSGWSSSNIFASTPTKNKL